MLVKLSLEALSMSMSSDDLSTWVQMLSDMGVTLGRLANRSCSGLRGILGPSVPGLDWESTGKGSAGLSPDVRCVFSRSFQTWTLQRWEAVPNFEGTPRD